MALVACSPTGAPTESPRTKACSTPEHRALDFWVGEWDVRGVKQKPGAPPSHSRISLVEGGCVVLEEYTTPSGYSGRSLNAYDPERKRWEQFWVDNMAGVHHYIGQARDGNMYYEAESVRFPELPQPVKVKMTFFNKGPDEVRQLIEQSTDGTSFTTLYDLTYRRRR